MSSVPVFINCRDRLSPLRALVDWLERAGCERIHLLDNDSTYPPLLEYYEQTPHTVIRLGENRPHKSFWDSGLLEELGIGGRYVFSDPDTIPIDECPLDAIDYFGEVLDRYPTYKKAGFGLRIDDLPDHYRLKAEVIAWEARFWRRLVAPRIYEAPIDTTFALYRGPEHARTEALRTGYPYLVRHTTWYLDSDNLPEEDLYYIERATGVTSWTRDEIGAGPPGEPPVRRERMLEKLERFAAEPTEQVAVDAVTAMDPVQRFHDLTEDDWLQANIDPAPEVAGILPSLPDEHTQRRFVGKTGADALVEGHMLARAFKDLYREHVGPLTHATRVLDYGCGWGRITRFFLKDIAAENLCGIDCNTEVIDFCRASNRWARFEVNDALPPTSFPGDHFDLVFAYSVFSHLREDVHLAWLDELRRLVKPSGLLILTVRPRHFISYCAELNADARSLRGPEVTLAGLFADPESALADYDAGKFVYVPYRGSSYGEWWGEACIPRAYVEREWVARGLELLDFVEDRARFKQDLVVLRRVA